jgi:hypothetical protein
VTLGANVTGVDKLVVYRAATDPALTLVANAQPDLQIYDTQGGDTIAVGAASQTIDNSGGSGLRVEATAADACATVIGGEAGATLEVTTPGTVTLAAGDSNLTVKLDAAAVLILNNMQFITADASVGNSVVTTEAAGQTVLSGISDTILDANSAGFTLTGAASNMNLDVIQNFNANDIIDITDFLPSATSVTASNVSGGVSLTLSSGGEQARMILAGFTDHGLFQVNSNGDGGSLITSLAR